MVDPVAARQLIVGLPGGLELLVTTWPDAIACAEVDVRATGDTVWTPAHRAGVTVREAVNT